MSGIYWAYDILDPESNTGSQSGHKIILWKQVWHTCMETRKRHIKCTIADRFWRSDRFLKKIGIKTWCTPAVTNFFINGDISDERNKLLFVFPKELVIPDLSTG